MELIVGPAGSGKTTALTPAVAYLRDRGQTVFGVASTAAAAQVLATELPSDTGRYMLFEKTAQNIRAFTMTAGINSGTVASNA